jgi:hypothetical protein
MMSGEAKEIYTEAGERSVGWGPAANASQSAANVWLKARFDLPALDKTDRSTALPVQLAHALRLTGVNKGVAYVNGFELGR